MTGNTYGFASSEIPMEEPDSRKEAAAKRLRERAAAQARGEIPSRGSLSGRGLE